MANEPDDRAVEYQQVAALVCQDLDILLELSEEKSMTLERPGWGAPWDDSSQAKKAEEAVIAAARKLGPDLAIALRLLTEYQAMSPAERCEKYGNGMFMMQDYFDETDLAALCDAVTRLDEAEVKP